MLRRLVVILVACTLIAAGAAMPALAREKITVWAWGEAAIAIQEQIKPDFEKLYPDIEVELVQMGPWDLMDKLLISIASGVGAPDVSEVLRRAFSPYAESGGLVDLTELASKYKNDVLPAAWAQSVFDGKLYGAPGDTNPGWVMYNKEIFDQYGLDPEAIVTWQDFLEVGQKLKEQGVYMTQLSIPAGSWGANHYTLFLNSRGGNLFTPEGQVIRNNELALDTLRFYNELKEVALALPQNDPAIWTAWKEGRLATMAHNAGQAAVLKQLAPELSGKIRVMPWPLWAPNAPATTGQWGGANWVIPEASTKKEAAWKFIEYMTFTKEGAAAMWSAGQLMPSYIPALETPAFYEPDPFFGGQVPFDAIRAREIPPLYQYEWIRAEEIIGNAIDAMFLQGVSPEQAWNMIESNLARLR